MGIDRREDGSSRKREKREGRHLVRRCWLCGCLIVHKAIFGATLIQEAACNMHITYTTSLPSTDYGVHTVHLKRCSYLQAIRSTRASVHTTTAQARYDSSILDNRKELPAAPTVPLPYANMKKNSNMHASRTRRVCMCWSANEPTDATFQPVLRRMYSVPYGVLLESTPRVLSGLNFRLY